MSLNKELAIGVVIGLVVCHLYHTKMGAGA
jgi:hypothetical protein